ncbi:MAG: phosphonate metabolism transcriptional regulator PhnF [Rhodobacteraceae bacterium]|nr:MAG: phosphonate metabolism transcriptional regulator PhnF [Paracoccaceae bacterium]
MPRSAAPVWRAIADALRADIREGRYGVLDRLPTEAALSERFGVNRHTVRHALAALVEEGLVHTRRGSGAFVAARPLDYPLGRRVRFRQNMLAAGRRPGRALRQIETRAADPGEAQALELDAGDPVCICRGTTLADGMPIAIFESVFPMDRLPGIAEALAEGGGVTAALAKAGVADYTRRSTWVTAVLADAATALHLQARAGDPLLRTTQVNVDPAGVPVEYGRTWFAGDRVTLTLEGQGS